MKNLSLIAAVAADGAIGKDNDLLCHLPNDLKHFKALTLDHTVVMGRRTFESLPAGPLPRRNPELMLDGGGFGLYGNKGKISSVF